MIVISNKFLMEECKVNGTEKGKVDIKTYIELGEL